MGAGYNVFYADDGVRTSRASGDDCANSATDNNSGGDCDCDSSRYGDIRTATGSDAAGDDFVAGCATGVSQERVLYRY